MRKKKKGSSTTQQTKSQFKLSRIIQKREKLYISKAVHQKLSLRTARRLCFNSRADPLRTFIPKRFRTMHTGCALSASRRIRRRSGTKRHVRRRNVALLVESSVMLIGGDASRAPGNIHEITGCRAALRFDARRSGNE